VTSGQILALIGLGAFHGLNPGMGWLFAVAIGLQERSASALLRALGPIALGHLASMAVVAVAITIGMSATTSQVVAIVGGIALTGLGLLLLLRRRHFRWVGMRLTAAQLALWSFLMASVHGAGLMLVPVLTATSTMDHHMPGMEMSVPVSQGIAAAAIHTAAMLAVAAGIALTVYHVLGLRILRSAWVNLDRVWAAVMVGAGGATVIAALA
jgi:MYXO-CTERM domain-containing protein